MLSVSTKKRGFQHATVGNKRGSSINDVRHIFIFRPPPLFPLFVVRLNKYCRHKILDSREVAYWQSFTEIPLFWRFNLIIMQKHIFKMNNFCNEGFVRRSMLECKISVKNVHYCQKINNLYMKTQWMGLSRSQSYQTFIFPVFQFLLLCLSVCRKWSSFLAKNRKILHFRRKKVW